jgi:hypothetical protein
MQALLIVLSATTLILGGTCVYLLHRIKVERMRRWETKARQQVHAPIAEMERVRAVPTRKVADIVRPIPIRRAQGAGGRHREYDYRAELRNKLRNPGAREAMREENKALNRTIHPHIAREVGLSPQEEDRLFDLLAEHHLRSMEASAADDNQTASAHRSAERDHEAALVALLNRERYARYKEYQNTSYERAQVKELSDMLDADHALRDDQATRLIAILRDERERVTNETIQLSREMFLSGQTRRGPSDVNPLEEASLRAREASAVRVGEQAAKILGTEQCRQLKQLLEARLSTERGVLEYRRTMRNQPRIPVQVVPRIRPAPKGDLPKK